MQSESLEKMSCCMEICKLLQSKSIEQLDGNVGFLMSRNDLFACCKTSTGNRVLLKIGEKYNNQTYKLHLVLDLYYKNPILELFEELAVDGQSKKQSPQLFVQSVIIALEIFFALNHQKFT